MLSRPSAESPCTSEGSATDTCLCFFLFCPGFSMFTMWSFVLYACGCVVPLRGVDCIAYVRGVCTTTAY